MLRRRFRLPVHRNDRTKTPRHDSKKRNHKEDPSHFRFQALIDRSIGRNKRSQRRPQPSKSPEPVVSNTVNDNCPSSRPSVATSNGSLYQDQHLSSPISPLDQLQEHTSTHDHATDERIHVVPVSDTESSPLITSLQTDNISVERGPLRPPTAASSVRSKLEPSQVVRPDEDSYAQSNTGKDIHEHDDSDDHESVTSDSAEEEESGVDLENADSESAPTQIIALSALTSDPSESELVRSWSEFQEDLRDLYGSSYRATDDIVGLVPPQDIDSSVYRSPMDVSTSLEAMRDKTGPGFSSTSYESITPRLLPPLSYSEALLDAVALIDDHAQISKTIVGAWIFFSLALSRIDGLILSYAVHCFLRLNGINGTPFLLTELSVLVKRYWFSDSSMLQRNRVHTDPPLRRGVVLTTPNSRNTSRVQAIIGGNNRGQSQKKSTVYRITPKDTDSNIPLLLESRSQNLNSHARNSRDDTDNETSITHAAKVPDKPQRDQSSLSEAEDSVNRSGSLAQESSQEENIGATFEMTDETTFSVQPPVEQIDQLQKDQYATKRRPSDETANLPLDCKHPSCDRNFVTESEYANHIQVWHRDLPDRDMNDNSRPETNVPLSGSVHSSLSSSSVKFQTCTDEEAYRFFVVGRVFATRWHGSSHSRRFVVVTRRQGYCWAVPIFSYGGRGLRRGDVSEDERQRYAIIHDSGREPQPVPGEGFFEKSPIPVELEKGQSLDIDSRLYFDRPHDIDWQSKVSNVGMVSGAESLRNLKSYFKAEFLRDEEEPTP